MNQEQVGTYLEDCAREYGVSVSALLGQPDSPEARSEWARQFHERTRPLTVADVQAFCDEVNARGHQVYWSPKQEKPA